MVSVGLAVLVWTSLVAAHGVTASPDTVTYWAAAEALADGGLHTPLHFRPFREPMPLLTGWPPGYPLILAVGVAFGIPWPVWLTLTSGAFFVVGAVLCGRLIAGLADAPSGGWAVPWLVSFAPLLLVSSRGWSEGPWFVVWALQGLAVAGWLRTGGSRRLVVAASLCGALFWFRHAAAPVLLVFPVFCWWVPGRGGVRAGVQAALVIALVVAPWVGGAFWASGDFGYHYPPSETGLLTVLSAMAAACAWAFADTALRVAEALPGVQVGLAVAVLVLAGWAGRETVRRMGPVSAGLAVWLLLAAVASADGYLLVRWGQHLDEPDGRIVLPVVLPMVVVALGWFVRRVHVRRPLFTVGVVWCLLVAADHRMNPGPRPYGWTDSSGFRELYHTVMVHTEPTDLVLCRLGMVVHQRTGRAVVAPLKAPYGEPMSDQEFERMVAEWPGEVVWVAPRDPGALEGFGRWWTNASGWEVRASSRRYEVWVWRGSPGAKPLNP